VAPNSADPSSCHFGHCCAEAGLPDGCFSKPKISIWVNFGGPLIGYILWPFGIFYRHLGYFMTIWYFSCSFGTFFPVWVIFTQKNLATLRRSSIKRWTNIQGDNLVSANERLPRNNFDK
jgi:hypothetical protein